MDLGELAGARVRNGRGFLYAYYNVGSCKREMILWSESNSQFRPEMDYANPSECVIQLEWQIAVILFTWSHVMKFLNTISVLILFAAFPMYGADRPLQTENVVLIMVDGVRWQEVVSGADENLLNKERGGVKEVDALRKRFWRETAAARREVLLPFLHGVVVKDGQLFGNQQLKSVGRVTNGLNFSYPGYNEVLCGFADPKVASNAKVYNKNVTVLEWLNAKPNFKGKVAAFASWDVFRWIINDERSGIPVNAGMMPLEGVEQTDEVRLLNRLISETPVLGEATRADALTWHAARIYLQAKKPRVLFLSFDETDTQAHNGRYDRVLDSAHKADGYLKELWEWLQSTPQYKGKTTMIITTDHGRGNAPVEWKSHGAFIKGAEFTWFAIVGPDTPALGERKEIEPIGQNQIAATMAALLGLDYVADEPNAGKQILDAIRRTSK